LPLFYEQDSPKFFAFFSDTNSHYGGGLRYQKGSLDAVSDSVSGVADFYFGCVSDQLVDADENKTDSFIYMFYGNAGKVREFNDSLLENDWPDYLTVFPFSIDDIGRAYRKKIFYENGTVIGSEDVNLSTWSASHFNGEKNTLIVEWGSKPAITEFRLTATSIFSQTSFSTKVLNVRISDQWMYEPRLVGNAPENFTLSLLIPKSYVIENSEQYSIQDDQNSPSYFRLTVNLSDRSAVRIVLFDRTSEFMKNAIDIAFPAFILAILVTIFYDKIYTKYF
jgi:hypothetical protein